VDANRPVVDALHSLVGQVELVLDFADDLLEQVLQGDDPLHRAVLVHDDRHVLIRPAELPEHGGKILRLRNHRRGPDELFDADRRKTAVADGGEEVTYVQDPDDLVERAAVDRVARVRRLDHRGQAVLWRKVD
jgi:hypothetical protein